MHELTRNEQASLSEQQLGGNTRLACQVTPEHDLRVRVSTHSSARDGQTSPDARSGLFEAFLRSAQYIVALQSQQDISEHLANLIVTHFPADWVAFGQRNSEDEISIHHCTSPDPELTEALLSGEVAAVITDVLESGFLATEVISTVAPSLVAFLPVVEESQPEAVILIGHQSPTPLSTELLDVYLALAGLAGTAFVRLHNEQELKRHRAYLEELVRERTAELAKAQRQNELILNSVREGISGVDLEGRITFVNPFAARMVGWDPAELIGLGAQEAFHGTGSGRGQIQADKSPVHSTLARQRTEYVSDEEFRRKDGSRFPVELTAAPLTEEGKTVGAVMVFRDISARRRAEEERERELRQVKVLNEVASACASSLDPQEMAGKVLGAVHHHLDAWAASIYWLEERAATLKQVAYLGSPGQSVAGLDTLRLDRQSALGAMLLSGDDYITHEEAPLAPAGDPGAAAASENRWVLVPLRVKGRLAGALALEFAGRRPFAPEELALYRSIAAQLATAIDNARLYEQTSSVADTLQEALVSLPREVPGIRFGHAYRSATEAARLGGDFYDVFGLPGGKVGILVGDVSGRGIEAASLASFTRETVRAYALHHDSPRYVMRLANEALIHRHGYKHFVTACLAFLDAPSGRVRYSLAGHPPPVRVGPGDTHLMQWKSCPPLGVFDEAHYLTGRCLLDREATLVFYTDGITEARGQGELFGEASLTKLLTRLSVEPPERLPGLLLSEVEAFSQGTHRDDAAVLAVKVADGSEGAGRSG